MPARAARPRVRRPRGSATARRPAAGDARAGPSGRPRADRAAPPPPGFVPRPPGLERALAAADSDPCRCRGRALSYRVSLAPDDNVSYRHRSCDSVRHDDCFAMFPIDAAYRSFCRPPAGHSTMRPENGSRNATHSTNVVATGFPADRVNFCRGSTNLADVNGFDDGQRRQLTIVKSSSASRTSRGSVSVREPPESLLAYVMVHLGKSAGRQATTRWALATDETHYSDQGTTRTHPPPDQPRSAPDIPSAIRASSNDAPAGFHSKALAFDGCSAIEAIPRVSMSRWRSGDRG